MTAIDKKIKELNEKLGRKTGVDFKASGENITRRLYANKPYLFGSLASIGVFVFTGAGFILSVLVGVLVYYGKRV